MLKMFLKKWKNNSINNKIKFKNNYLFTDTSINFQQKQKRYNTLDKNKNTLKIKRNLPNFYKRMMLYNEKKENDNIKNMVIKEEEFNINCTFCPNLILTSKKNKELKETIKAVSLNKKRVKDEKPKKILDKERIYRLYDDYQQQNIKKEILKKNIDIENGITFSPYINYESPYYKNIKDDLFKRNEKLLEDKKEFVDGFNYLRNLQMKGININQGTLNK